MHVLGVGSIGGFAALRISQHRPVNLILSSTNRLLQYQQAGGQIKVIGPNETISARIPAQTADDLGKISTLLVCTKAGQTRRALEPLVSRLDAKSKIVFVQNGMGVVDSVRDLWPRDDSPDFIQAITKQGSQKTPVAWVFKATEYLPFTLEKPVDELNFQPFEFSPDFKAEQLEKLVINSVANPLTALLRCQNGELLQHRGLIDSVTRESSAIIAKTHPSIRKRFAYQRMTGLVYDALEKTAANITSMRADIESGQETEIDFINGYIVSLAKEHGLKAGQNELLVKLIKLAKKHSVSQLFASVPNVDSYNY